MTANTPAANPPTVPSRQDPPPGTVRMLLSQYLTLQPPAEAFFGYLKSLADALALLHRAGYYCLDLRPENVTCRPDGTAILTPTCHRKDAGAFLTPEQAHWQLPEKNAYTAPELRRFTGEYIERYRLALYGGRSDVYSLGLILYQYLMGFPVLTYREVILLRERLPGSLPRNRFAPGLRSLPAPVLTALGDLLAHSLSRTVAARLPDMTEFRDRLDAILLLLRQSREENTP